MNFLVFLQRWLGFQISTPSFQKRARHKNLHPAHQAENRKFSKQAGRQPTAEKSLKKRGFKEIQVVHTTLPTPSMGRLHIYILR